MNFSPDRMQQDLQTHTRLAAELLDLAVRENQLLRNVRPGVPGLNDYRRKELLSLVQVSLEALRVHRSAWQKVPDLEKKRHTETERLIHGAQAAGLKFIVLDRENEQLLLRRNLLPACTPGHGFAPAGE